mgnify:CR=1 FL=1
MIRTECPFCGPRSHTEFAYGGDGSFEYPHLGASTEEWLTAVFEREYTLGPRLETWQHVMGCRMWLKIRRDTLTHEITSVKPANAGLGKVVNNER